MTSSVTPLNSQIIAISNPSFSFIFGGISNFPSNGQSYSRVCGRINAYQFGTPSAFGPSVLGNPGLEGVYLEGVSLTYGDAGSRRHIWSFANALLENDPNYQSDLLEHVCSCMH